MRMPLFSGSKRALVAGAAMLALLAAGAAEASGAGLHTMKVAAPDGSIVHVQYQGDVAPHVQFVPVSAEDASLDPFMEMDRVSAVMDAQMTAMMRQAAAMQQAVQMQAAQMQSSTVAANAQVPTGEPGLTLVGDVPQGMHVTYYSSTTDANGCTRSVSYASGGSGAQPRMTQVVSDGCDAVAKAPAGVTSVKAQAPASRQIAPEPARQATPEPAAPPPGARV